jgi:uncharacterized OB-fold protein
MDVYEKPLPVVNEDNAPYWAYARQHELRMQQCATCGYIRFPPGLLCPKCHSLDHQWARLSGKGKLYSYVVYHHAYHPSYKNDLPYAVVIIQLAEGPRMESNIVGCKMEDLRIDMPLEVCFDDVTDTVTLPKFKPALGLS